MKQGLIHIAGFVLLLAAGTAARGQNTNAGGAATNSTVAASPATNAAASNTPADAGQPRMSQRVFQIIETRNIFDPNRRPRVARDTGPRVVVEYFGLSGEITYEDQAYAFFDGSGQFRNRGYGLNDKINGYTLAAITNNGVRLEGPSNQVVNLGVGMQMRRENNGPWKLVSNMPADSGSSQPSGDSSAEGAASSLSGPEADVMTRLMKRRAEEMKDSTGSTSSTDEGTGTNEIH